MLGKLKDLFSNGSNVKPVLKVAAPRNVGVVAALKSNPIAVGLANLFEVEVNSIEGEKGFNEKSIALLVNNDFYVVVEDLPRGAKIPHVPEGNALNMSNNKPVYRVDFNVIMEYGNKRIKTSEQHIIGQRNLIK